MRTSSGSSRRSRAFSTPWAAWACAAALALCPRAARAADDVELYATLSSPQVSLGDTVTLQVVLSGSGSSDADIALPPMPDLDVVSQHRSSSTQISLGAGGSQITRQAVLTVVLAPKQQGTLKIPPATAEVNGHTYQTSSLTLRVLPAGQAQRSPPQPQQPPDPFQQLFGGSPFGNMPLPDMNGDPSQQMLGQAPPPGDSDLFLRALLDKKQAYLGEQVTLSVYLFSRVDVSGVDDFKLPKLDAFWAEDIESPTQITGDVKMVHGVPYRVYLLKRRALFPLKAGKQGVDPVEVEVTTGMSIFGNGHKSHRATQPLDLEVEPLPPGAPPGFESTNVGQWQIEAATSPPGVAKATVGQPVTLDVILKGLGNLKNLSFPKLPPIAGFRAFDPTVTDKVQVVRGRFGGKRTLEYLLMPEQTGALAIPSLAFTFFDPVNGTYQTRRTEPIHLEVGAGAGGASGVASSAASVGVAGGNVLSGGLLKPIHYRSELAAAGAPPYHRRFFFPALVLPWALWILGAAGIRLRALARRDDPSRRVRTAQSRARKRFKGAELLLEGGEAGAYYGQVAKALSDYLTDKLGIAAAGLTRDQLGRLLLALGARPETVARLCEVLEGCDHGRFAPGGAGARRKVLDDAAKAIEALESERLKAAPPPQEARA